MLDWFQRLLPREQKFFPLFERHANVVTTAAESLRRMLEGGEQNRGAIDVLIALERREKFAQAASVVSSSGS